jgi:hypothetical protein
MLCSSARAVVGNSWEPATISVTAVIGSQLRVYGLMAAEITPGDFTGALHRQAG